MRSISSFKLHLAGLKTWWYQGRRQFAYRIMITATIPIHFDGEFPQGSKLNEKVKCAPKYEKKKLQSILSILYKFDLKKIHNKIIQILVGKIEFFSRVITCFWGRNEIEFVYVWYLRWWRQLPQRFWLGWLAIFFDTMKASKENFKKSKQWLFFCLCVHILYSYFHQAEMRKSAIDGSRRSFLMFSFQPWPSLEGGGGKGGNRLLIFLEFTK